MSKHPNLLRSSFIQFVTAVTKSLSLALLLLALSLIACGSTSKATVASERAVEDRYAAFDDYYVDFMHTDRLSEAVERAKAEGKLIFIDFYTSWCLPCKLMDEDVFTDRALGSFMNENFISLKINAEYGNGPNLATLYNVQAYPTLLFIDPSGKVLAKKQGAAYQTELRKMGNAALAAR